ncbi:MAG: Fmu (Sun) domain-containing protein [Flavisolibacter sp.]|nr:Fmu (Sun) domain-containing protein [Flavisolibacter sp.]
MRSYSYLNTASRIIQSYDGSMPLAAWLKQFFKADKKFGSKDRKNISHACYCFYRLGSAFQNLNTEERVLTALFLCSDTSNKILEELKPGWNEQILLPLSEKVTLLSVQEEIKKIFPFRGEVSKEIELQSFTLSFLIQPDLYLKIRPGKKERVLRQLQNAGVQFTLLTDECIQLSNQSKVDEVVNIDEDVIIQDYNSQRTIELFQNHKPQTTNYKLSAWDCCAASGGKSILFHGHFPLAQLTVSDVRESILINLQKRFKRAGIKNYDHFVADVSSAHFSIQKKFDLVICDAPCSGSGTWSRTPEQLKFFKKEKMEHYASLQKRIALNASKAVKKNGHFLYITCSVFEKENEEVVNFIQSNSAVQLKAMEYLKGYDKKADTLFAALFSAL